MDKQRNRPLPPPPQQDFLGREPAGVLMEIYSRDYKGPKHVSECSCLTLQALFNRKQNKLAYFTHNAVPELWMW